jgi:hypothetical protein
MAIEIPQRADWTIPYEVVQVDESGTETPVDITGYTLYFVLKKLATDSDADAIISKTVTSHTNPTLGLTSVALTAAELDIAIGNYLSGVVLKTTSGSHLPMPVVGVRITENLIDTIH